MPPAHLITALPDLDDHDVSVLYDIICLAAESRQRPIKSLFDAYERIIAGQGSEGDPGSKYFRFLSHAGSYLAKRGNGGLVRQFQSLLSSAGIQLVLDDEAAPEPEPRFEDESDDDHVRDEAGPPRGRTRRRASFNDTNLDSTWLSTDRLTKPQHDLVQRHSSHEPRVTADSNFLHTARRHGLPHGYDREADRPPPLGRYHMVPSSSQLQAAASDFAYAIIVRRCFWAWQGRAQQIQRRQLDLMQIAVNHDHKVLLKQSYAQMKDSVREVQFWQQQARRASRARGLFLLTKAFTHWAQVTADETAKVSAAKQLILQTRCFNAWRDITVVNEIKCRRIAMGKWFSHWRSRSLRAQHNERLAVDFDVTRVVLRTYWTWFWSFCERKAPIWKEARLRSTCFNRLREHAAARQSMVLAAQFNRNQHCQLRSLRSLNETAVLLQDREVTSLARRTTHLKTFAFAALCRRRAFDPRELDFRRSVSRRIVRDALRIWCSRARMNNAARVINHARLLSNSWTAWNDTLRIKCLERKFDDQLLLRVLYKWILAERSVLFDRISSHRLMSTVLGHLQHATTERQFKINEADMIFSHNQRIRLLQSSTIRFHASIRKHEQAELAAIEFRNVHTLPMAVARLRERAAHSSELNSWAARARYFCLTTTAVRKWKQATAESQRRRRREAFAVIRARQKADLLRNYLAVINAYAVRLATMHKQAADFKRKTGQNTGRMCLTRLAGKTRSWQRTSLQAEQIIVEFRLGDTFSAMILKLSDVAQMAIQADHMENGRQVRNASRTLRRLGDIVFMLQRHEDTTLAWRSRKLNMHVKELLRGWASAASTRRATRFADDAESPSRTPMLRASRRPDRPFAGNDDYPVVDQSFGLRDMFDTSAQDDTAKQSPSNLISFSATPLPAYLRTPRSAARKSGTAARFPGLTREMGTTPGSIDFNSSIVLGSTTPAPYRPGDLDGMEALTPQVTPFQRRLRAAGYRSAAARRAGAGAVGTPLPGPTLGQRSRLQSSRVAVRFKDAGDEIDESTAG